MDQTQVQSELSLAQEPTAVTIKRITDETNEVLRMHRESGRIAMNQIYDGYHTIGELYDHRIELFIALCRTLCHSRNVWRSMQHHDGSNFDGWFIMGLDTDKGKQISYHLPMSKWDDTHFAQTLATAPEWDGHTSADVLKRLKNVNL
jgi:Ser/Thr protein kinase RdoA (MazF antagonist)